jgi:hypothetical protein
MGILDRLFKRNQQHEPVELPPLPVMSAAEEEHQMEVNHELMEEFMEEAHHKLEEQREAQP